MKRPKFDVAWAASQKIYDHLDPAAKVAEVVGGKVTDNINSIDSTRRWNNTCAVRLSYILNQSGMTIPFAPGKTVSGRDKKWYFHYVKDVIAFLREKLGQPDLIIRYPPSGSDIRKMQGIIIFEVPSWNDASGHATLWNGNMCFDHCYFNEPGASYKTEKASFWSLP